jgi:hypothetical protein
MNIVYTYRSCAFRRNVPYIMFTFFLFILVARSLGRAVVPRAGPEHSRKNTLLLKQPVTDLFNCHRGAAGSLSLRLTLSRWTPISERRPTCSLPPERHPHMLLVLGFHQCAQSMGVTHRTARMYWVRTHAAHKGSDVPACFVSCSIIPPSAGR